MKYSQNLNEILRPNEMPMFWGSLAKPDLPPKIRLVYALGWIVVLFAAGLQNNMVIANIYEIQGNLGLTPAQGTIITAAYYMGYAWMSVVLFKMRQQFGMKIFFSFALTILVVVHGIQILYEDFYIAAITRFLNGLVGSSLTTLCVYYVLQMLPPKKSYLTMCLSIGLIQVGSSGARWMLPYLMINENAHLAIFIDMGTTLFVLVTYLLIELPPSQTGKSFSLRDAPSILFYATGTAILCLIFSIGNTIWWNQPWIAYGLCIAISCFILFFILEHYREKPLINFSFIGKFQVLRLCLAAAFARMCLAEQTTGATGLFKNVLGYTDYQLIPYYGVITLGALFGGLSCIAVMSYKRTGLIMVISFAMLIVGSFASTGLSPSVMPSNLYFSQFLIAASSVFFIGPLFSEGMTISLPRGGNYVITFIVIFGFSQSVFGLLGSALIGYFIKVSTSTHLQNLINHSPDTSALNTLIPNLSAELNKQAGVLAYNDLFYIIGLSAGAIFVLLTIHWIYYMFLKTTPIDRELDILARRSVNKNLKTQVFMQELETKTHKNQS
ncbi:hypothetical protein BKH41_02110 [Helicobacter sp. 12S02232-10]|uniref:MFS transporter n=1 Tax=Helicobacter sp. 12S02232-10 TaxID=1476197 RepID=UPI000BA5DAD5|nr:MFS transporter [Helicobacter sp. 12S02232-10]PAF49481.1 hypothetical protein BKH41_02110 [Helicobacter sp. 12S02232-10]